MKRFSKLAAIFLAAASLLIFGSSCGYHLGSMAHPQLKTIAIAPVKNDTLEPMAADIMRQQLCEQFQVDGSLKLVSLQEADIILYCKISKVANKDISWHSTDRQVTYRPFMFTLEITSEFSVVMPGRGEPVIPSRGVSETATYEITADPEQGRSNGVKQACYNSARKMVEYTVEAW